MILFVPLTLEFFFCCDYLRQAFLMVMEFCVKFYQSTSSMKFLKVHKLGFLLMFELTR